jgi:hypothetical protein
MPTSPICQRIIVHGLISMLSLLVCIFRLRCSPVAKYAMFITIVFFIFYVYVYVTYRLIVVLLLLCALFLSRVSVV